MVVVACVGVKIRGISCGRTLPHTRDYFPWRVKGVSLRNTCIKCHGQHTMQCRSENRERAAKHTKNWHARNPLYRTIQWLKTKYDLTIVQYFCLIDSHAGRCRICSNPETSKGPRGGDKPLAIDHCHSTGRVRGLLCQSCNTCLAAFDKQPYSRRAEFASRIVKYLEGADGL